MKSMNNDMDNMNEYDMPDQDGYPAGYSAPHPGWDYMTDEAGMPPYPGELPQDPLIDEEGNFASDWHRRFEALDEDGKSLAKFKSPEALAKSYAQLERMKRYPGVEEADKMVAFRRMVGLPDDPEEYKINKPDDVDDTNWDQVFVDQMARVAYDYGVPPQAMDALSRAYCEAQKQAIESYEDEARQSIEAAERALQEEWGSRYENTMRKVAKTVERLANRAGVVPDMILDDPDISSNPAFIRIMNEAAKMLDESPLRGDDVLAPSPSQEARRIESDPSHPLHEAYMNPGHPNHKYANETYDRLAFGKY